MAAQSTVDLTSCRSMQMAAADALLARYVKAAKKQAMTHAFDARRIAEEQSAWERYRALHCGNVDQLWSAGTIRYDKTASCQLKLTQDRTVDIWNAYLFATDAEPVLPYPQLGSLFPPLHCRFNQGQSIAALKLGDANAFTLIWSDGPRQSYALIANHAAIQTMRDALGGTWHLRSGRDHGAFTLTNVSNGNLIACQLVS